jgi:PmbA protein
MEIQNQALAEKVLEMAKSCGAEEAKVSVSRASHVELDQREGRLEKTSESLTQGLTLTLIVEGRSSAHSTSDLRPEALSRFVGHAVDATRVLEPDPDYRQLPLSEMGKIPLSDLDLVDPTGGRSPVDRLQQVTALEQAVLERTSGTLISATASVWESNASRSVLFSNGFQGSTASTQYGMGSEVTLSEEGGKRPEASAYFSSRHCSDLPSIEQVADEAWARSAEGLNGSPAESGRYTLILANRAVGRILGAALGPLSGSAIWQKRSLYADKLGEKIAASQLSVWDDPTLPRAHGSRCFDGDGLCPKRRPIIKDGVLQTWLLDAYHSRKLGLSANGGGMGNVVVAPGTRSWKEIAGHHQKAIRVTSFLGGNSNSTSGDFSFGIRGQLLENGEVVQNVVEMNVAGNLIELLEKFSEAANDPWMFSSYRVPSMVFEGIQFSGS